jgi:hypothetical protein
MPVAMRALVVQAVGGRVGAGGHKMGIWKLTLEWHSQASWVKNSLKNWLDAGSRAPLTHSDVRVSGNEVRTLQFESTSQVMHVVR